MRFRRRRLRRRRERMKKIGVLKQGRGDKKCVGGIQYSA